MQQRLRAPSERARPFSPVSSSAAPHAGCRAARRLHGGTRCAAPESVLMQQAQPEAGVVAGPQHQAAPPMPSRPAQNIVPAGALRQRGATRPGTSSVRLQLSTGLWCCLTRPRAQGASPGGLYARMQTDHVPRSAPHAAGAPGRPLAVAVRRQCLAAVCACAVWRRRLARCHGWRAAAVSAAAGAGACLWRLLLPLPRRRC